jgi:hypothetical protein
LSADRRRGDGPFGMNLNLDDAAGESYRDHTSSQSKEGSRPASGWITETFEGNEGVRLKGFRSAKPM